MEIVLVRHGKPVSASNAKLDVNDFARWIDEYDQSKVDTTSYPSDELLNICVNSLIISSALPRAVHSAELASHQTNSKTYSLLNEMKIPAYFMPFKMSVSYWLFINRFLWFLGFSGNVESYKKAKERSRLMVAELVNLATTNKRIVVFGHGLLNRQISKELIKLGWQKGSQSSAYWGMQKLSKD